MERIAFAAQARLEDTVGELEVLGRKFREGVGDAVRNLGRERVH